MYLVYFRGRQKSLSVLFDKCLLIDIFYFIKSFAAFSVILSQIVSQNLNFSCKFSVVTQILEVNVSLSLNAETRMYGSVCLFLYAMRIRETNLRHVD